MLVYATIFLLEKAILIFIGCITHVWLLHVSPVWLIIQEMKSANDLAGKPKLYPHGCLNLSDSWFKAHLLPAPFGSPKILGGSP